MTRWTELARRAHDDRGSLPMVLLVTVVGMLLTGLLVPVLLNQAHTTRFDATRVTSLDAAQAGTDLALGRIRNARDAQGNGIATKLPCGPISGSVDTNGAATYRVTIKYFTTDPTGTTTPAAMLCIDGYGTYDGASGVVTPSWAQVTAVGTGGGGNGASQGRTLVTTYGFKMDNTNVPSGVLRIFPASGTSAPLCLDAGNATTSTTVMLQPCSTTVPVAAPQAFVYRTDLTLQLQSSVTGSNANGNCLSYPSSDSVNPTSGATVTLAACQSLGNPPWNQQWSFDDNGHFRASLKTSKNDGGLSTLCMDVASQAATTGPTLRSCAGGTTDPRQAWIPAPAVGAGAAAPPQWVNYFEFGRCLDVTNQDVNKPFLIDYPCKQNPYPGAVAWNQKFTAPTIPAGAVSATGQFYTTKDDGSKYCLTSPGTRGGLVVVKTCNQAGQIWTVYNNDDSLGYTKKFTIVDSSSPDKLCLGLTVPQEGMVWSALDVDTCVGRTDQKWNADPTTASILGTQEN